MGSKLEKIKSGLVKAGRWTANALGQAGDNFNYNEERIELKKDILLHSFSIKELNNLKRKHNIIFPGDMFNEDINYTKEELASGLATEFKLETLKQNIKDKKFLNDVNRREREIEERYSKRREERWKKWKAGEITTEEAIEEENPLLNILINTLSDMYLPDKILDERELQNVIFTSLKNNPSYATAREEYIIDERRPDIIINDIVIELKVIKDKNSALDKLRKAGFQALEYKNFDFIKNVILYLFVGDQSAESIVNEYAEKFEKLGIQTIIKSGGIRKAKVKRVYPNIYVSYKG